jgi:hypothetical protein
LVISQSGIEPSSVRCSSPAKTCGKTIAKQVKGGKRRNLPGSWICELPVFSPNIQ